VTASCARPWNECFIGEERPRSIGGGSPIAQPLRPSPRRRASSAGCHPVSALLGFVDSEGGLVRCRQRRPCPVAFDGDARELGPRQRHALRVTTLCRSEIEPSSSTMRLLQHAQAVDESIWVLCHRVPSRTGPFPWWLTERLRLAALTRAVMWGLYSFQGLVVPVLRPFTARASHLDETFVGEGRHCLASIERASPFSR